MNRGRATTADVLPKVSTPPSGRPTPTTEIPASAPNGALDHQRDASRESARHSGVADARGGLKAVRDRDGEGSGNAIPGSNPEYPSGYVRGCTGKHRYPNKKSAATKLNRIMRSHRRNRPDYLRAYHCEHCNGWHLTKEDRP